MGRIKGKSQEQVSDRIHDIVIGRYLKRRLLIAALEREMRLTDYIVAVLQRHSEIDIPVGFKVVIREGSDE
jgi:hypothetical protein